MNTTIEVQNLSKHYGDITAVDDLSFGVRSGRVTGFLGRNGSGKTTTMRMMLGLAAPTSGRATFGGRTYSELARPDPRGRRGDRLRRVPSEPHRPPAPRRHGDRRRHRPLPGQRGAVDRRTLRGRRPPRRGVLDGDASAPRTGMRPPRRSTRAAPRRTTERSRSRRHRMGPRHPSPTRIRGTHDPALQPRPRRGCDHRRRRRRHRAGPSDGGDAAHRARREPQDRRAHATRGRVDDRTAGLRSRRHPHRGRRGHRRRCRRRTSSA